MLQEGLATATIGLPVSVPGNIAVAKGAYTEIVDIVAPSSAPAGETVSVTIKIKNIWTTSVHVYAVGVRDSEDRFIDWLDYWISPGSTHSFSGSFIMPARDVTIHAYSYYEADDGYLYFDDEKEKDVDLAAAVWQKLTSQTIIITPIVWQKLATKTVSITPITWQKLATKTVAITPIPVEWVKLASKTVQIAPVAVEWQKLASKTVAITPEAVPWELVYHHEYPQGETYVGPAEECTSTLTIPLPDQLFPNNWVIEKIADTFAEEMAKEGGEMLDVKIYEDATPTWSTNYKIVAIAHASPFPWVVVIPLILAIILVIAFIKLVIEFKDIDWGEIPAAIPWAILALAGGLGILGVGAAVALAMPRPKE